ncbi:MAG: hypothetical protein ITG02_12480 [Patulibacter sp.]|nr:hypothetical protein [Patulibacter sp.]
MRLFTVRPWREEFGAADCPERLLGTAVVRIVRVREDRRAALVKLSDRRFALTGDILAAGKRDDLRRYVQRRAHASNAAPAERQWLEECAVILDTERAARPVPGGGRTR